MLSSESALLIFCNIKQPLGQGRRSDTQNHQKQCAAHQIEGGARLAKGDDSLTKHISKVGDAGAKILTDFFKQEIRQFLTDDLDPLGRQIIECCLNDGTLEEYLALTPMRLPK